MHIGDSIKKSIEEKKTSVIKIAKYLGLSRPSVYRRLENGKFYIHEINILKNKGII